jgi:predicted ATP-dependent serine protease
MTATVTHFTQVVPEAAERLSSGIPELDWLYGCNPGEAIYGMPRGRLCLWAGQAGVGKTRVTIELCKKVLAAGHKVLYFTLEMPPGQFKQLYCKGIDSTCKFYLSGNKSLADQAEAICQHQPHLVVVDSVPEIEEYNGTDRAAKLIQREYRQAAGAANAHVIFIGHLNVRGTVKGGSRLPHMVDTVFRLYPMDEKIKTPLFIMDCPDKNRYGRPGKDTVWCHNDRGVECQSDHRTHDPDYTKHNRQNGKRKWRLWR